MSNRVVLRFIGEDSALRRTLRRVNSETSKTLSGLSGMSVKALSSFTAIGKPLALLAAGGGAIQTIGGVAAAGAQLLPVALLLPGALLAGAAAMATFKLATAGFADALKGDKEAMAKLHPEAQKTVLAIQALNPQIDKLKKLVQGEFFRGFSTEVRALGGEYLPLLQKRLPAIASGFNTMAREAAKALRRPNVKDSIDQVLINTAKTLAGMPHALGNFAAGFAILAGAGSKRLTPLGVMVDKLSDKFNHWADGFVKSGAFDVAVNNAMSGLRELGVIGANVFKVVGSIWTALQAGSAAADKAAGGNGKGGPLGFLKDLSAALVTTFNNPKVQAGIRALGQAMADVAGAAGGTFLSLINALVPLFVQIQPLVTSVAQFLGTVLRDAFYQLGPAISDFLKWFVPWVDRQLPKIATVIRDNVLPAIVTMIGYFNDNKAALKEFFVMAGLVALGLAGLATPIISIGILIAGAAVAWIEFGGVIKWVGKFVIEIFAMIAGGIADLFDLLSQIPGASLAFGSIAQGARKAQQAALGLVGGIDKVQPKAVEVKANVKGTGDVFGLVAMIDRVRNKIVQVAAHVSSIISNPFGVPRRAVGGTVNQGRSYLVGERGPEYVTMGASGYVTPNHKIGQSSGGARGSTVTFAGNVDSTFAAAFMKLVREGKIQIA